MATFERRPGTSRSTSNPPTFQEEWVCEGLFNSSEVKASAVSLTPSSVLVVEGILFRDDIQVREAGYCVYYVTVSYKDKKNEPGTYSFSFSSTGGTLHITHSLETIAKYPGIARTMNQAIDVGKDNVPRGTSLVIPALKMSYKFKHPLGVVNEAFALAMYEVTATCNDSAWHGMAAGEALLLGVDGSDGTDTEAEATYHIIREKNLSGLIIGGITGIAKDGHELIWVHWEDDVVAGKPGVKPRAVYREKLYNRVNFSAVLGF